MIIYDIQNLVKTYPGQTQPANKNIYLQILEAEIFGILGDNGAGKSTLVRQMVNLLASDSGSISLLGKNIIEAPDLVQMNVDLSPATYAADALRQTLLPTGITQKLVIDIVVLVGFSLFTFYLVTRKVDWRQQ